MSKRKYYGRGQRLGERTEGILRALGLGPTGLRRLAFGVYGDGSAASRRKVAYVLQTLGDVVEPVPDRAKRSGVWRLASVARKPEAAE